MFKTIAKWWAEDSFSVIDICIYGVIIMNCPPGWMTFCFILLGLFVTGIISKLLVNWSNR